MLFDRFYGAQLGGHAVDLLLEGHVNGVVDPAMEPRARLPRRRHRRQRFPRSLGPSSTPGACIRRFTIRNGCGLSRTGVDYLLPIFANAIGQDDMESVPRSLFVRGNLTQPYHSVNVDVNKRICYLD